jgi:hypothetical protein
MDQMAAGLMMGNLKILAVSSKEPLQAIGCLV